MGDTFLWVIFGVGGLYMGALWAVSMLMGSTEKIGSQLHTLAEELAPGFGMKLERYSASEFVYSGKIEGRDATLTLRIVQESGVWSVSRFELDVSMSLPAVKVRFAGEDTGKLGGGGVTEDGVEALGLSPAPIVAGSVGLAQMILNPELCAFLMKEPFGATRPSVQRRWSQVTFDGGVCFVHEAGASRNYTSRAVSAAATEWERMREWAREVVRRCPEQVDVPQASYLSALDEAQEATQRARAARVLLTRHAGTPQAVALREEAAGRGDVLEAVCVLGEDGATFEVCKGVLEVEGALGVQLARELGARWPWETFVEARCPTEVRAELMEEALGRAPEDPGDDFVRLLVSEWRGDGNRREVYRRFREWGWAPGPAARAALARGAIASIRLDLIKELEGREVTREDAPMLLALKERGHEGDVAPYLEALGGEAVGLLTLSGGEAAGGLTQLGERGALTPTKD
jgi:hypothetical protein